MSDCNSCPVETLCGYQYKPCDCVHQRKFKPMQTVTSDRPPMKQIDSMNLRLKFSDKSSITAIPDPQTHGAAMAGDVKIIALEWLKHLNMPINQKSLDEARFEFLLQSTLDYIKALEGVLEGLQSDPETPDALLEEIEKVLQ